MLQFFGYITFGYWRYFITAPAAHMIESKDDSLMSLIYTDDPALQKNHFCPPGKVEEWLRSGTIAPRPKWISAQEAAVHSKVMLKGGYSGPLNW